MHELMYVSLCLAWGLGDPHFTTLDGKNLPSTVLGNTLCFKSRMGVSLCKGALNPPQMKQPLLCFQPLHSEVVLLELRYKIKSLMAILVAIRYLYQCKLDKKPLDWIDSLCYDHECVILTHIFLILCRFGEDLMNCLYCIMEWMWLTGLRT